MQEAVEKFFPDHKNWDLNSVRNLQAENIQILADSYPRDTSNTSLIIYDNGEGQHPEAFERTFLSLLEGNKNEIHFVQGKYNMGGSGAIVFCGKQRYQLIASKRYDGSGEFGFTLIRKHPLSEAEAKVKKNTWYEYLKINEKIPSFPISELDLALQNRKFRTGTIVKLYSYELKGNRNIRRDLWLSLNEFLYEPALPIYTIESRERYPNDNVLQNVVFGLKRRIESSDYVETTLSEDYSNKQIGRMKVTAHVFKAKVKDRTSKETKDYIQREFFKNNMSVLFSMNGHVHGYYTSEFITRSLKFNLLRDHLLIHVDCTDMKYAFRSELFMASRDRLKQGDESSTLRDVLRKNLSEGQLWDIYKKRKDNISVQSVGDDDLLKSFAENLPISDDLRHLLSKTFKLDEKEKEQKKPKRKPSSNDKQKEVIAFQPKRYPSFFKLAANKNGETPVVEIPLNGSRVVQFESDVENEYFDRVEDPGDMTIGIMTYTPNDSSGGNKKGSVNDISEIFNVKRQSPNDGKIKVILEPDNEMKVGDEVQVKVDLTSPSEIFTQSFWVKISDPLTKPKKKVVEPEEEKIGLPKYHLVYETAPDGEEQMTWDRLAEASIQMDWDVVMHPQIEGDVLEAIYINMDSSVLKNYKSGIKNLSVEQSQIAHRRYISAVYFHTLFLYVINRKRNYIIATDDGVQSKDIDLTDYLKDIFSSHYADFLMKFGTGELVEALG
ncbi:MAG: hypothetical protein IT327_06360 [Anaerolineae bacterium]|nr:hypothetical protein [Anaerolineae bacterium]